MNKYLSFAIKSVSKDRDNAADNLHRAKTAFQGLSKKEMEKPYGESRDSKQEIVDGYSRKLNEMEETLNYLQNLLNMLNLSKTIISHWYKKNRDLCRAIKNDKKMNEREKMAFLVQMDMNKERLKAFVAASKCY